MENRALQLFRIPETRQKILNTLGLLLAFRFGFQVPIPGMSQEYLSKLASGMQAGVFGVMNAFTALFSGGEEQPARRRGAFVVPAFQTPLAAVTELVRRYTLAFPSLGEKLGERLVGGRYWVEDARKLAHFALIATEVEKPDVLKNLDYEIEFGPARLLGVPFVRIDSGWRDALYEIRIP